MAGTAEFLTEAFLRRYGAAHRLRIWRAPGRVNLIGEHTDYNLGLVLPMALELACFVVSAPSEDNRLRVYSENLCQARDWAVAEIPSLAPAGDWTDYLIGVARELARAGHALQPKNLLVWGTVPVGSGLSSSAALEVASALALLDAAPADRRALARLCLRAETDFVGLPCGIMDQYTSLFGHASGAILIDCRSLEHEVVNLPPGAQVVAVNTMVRHELGQSAYRERVAECAAAVEAARRCYPEIESLRDLDSTRLEAAAASIPATPLKRARHVVSENERVRVFQEFGARGDLYGMGGLFVESHRSLARDYEVSCAELDALVEIALGVPGVYGARMTGGGFGGCTVTLLCPDASDEFEATVTECYRERFGITPEIYPCWPAPGAAEVRLTGVG